MSNIIQIKRGSSVPTTSQLAEYELGFNTANNTLYINNGTEVVVPFANVPLASATQSGIVSTTEQFFGGRKVFIDGIYVGGYKSNDNLAEYGVVYFRSPSYATRVGAIQMQALNTEGKRTNNRFTFYEYSYTADTTTTLSWYDAYRLPTVAAGKTDHNTYDILTTKNLITVAQGGTGAATAAINTVFAGPGSGSTAAPSFRALVAADIPNLNASKITDGTLAVAQGGTGLTSLATFVRTTGDQTINGTKTFVAYPRIQASTTAANPYPSIMFNSSHDTDIARWGVALSGTGDESRAAYLAGDIYSYNASTKEKISYRERYRLPEVTADLPDNATYYIFTDKNNPTMSRTSGAVYYSATRSDTSTNVWFGVASSGTNHGVYSTKQSRWLIYGDATDVYVAGSLYHKITIGTADPSGGSNGDIYIKYST